MVPQENSKHVHRIAGWRRAVLWPMCALLRLWGRTLRFELSEEGRAVVALHPCPVIFVCWHNRLFAASELFRRYFPSKRIYCLISASKDGAWLSEFFQMSGMHTVRGSSSNLGREALHGLAERLRAGDDTAVTPDGPRGPVYVMKGGGVILARKTGATSLLMGVDFDRAWRVPSWDRFYLPVPWSTVRISFELRTADQLRNSEDPIGQLEADMIRMNPDRLAPAGIKGNAEPRAV